MSDEIVNAPATDTSTVDTTSDTTDTSADDAALIAAAEAVDKAKAEPKKEPAKAEKQLRKFKLKVDGEDAEEEIDLADEEGLTRRFQMAKASGKRMQEAAEMRKAAEEFIDMLRKNPKKVLSDPSIGVDIKQFAKEILDEEIANLEKSPEQIERERLQNELEQLKDRYKKDEESRKAKEFQRLQADAEKKLEGDISTALQGSNLPKTPYTVRKMAEIMMIALQNDIDLPVKDVVPILRRQMQTDIKDMFSASSDDILEELVGKENISRLRKRTIAKAKETQAVDTANSVKATGTEKKKEDAPKEAKKISMRDFLRG